MSDKSADQSFDLILASKSPRRRRLLEDAGITFRVVTPTEPVDERLEEGEATDPVEACKKLAERKAGAVVQELLAHAIANTTIVLGADTMVVQGDEVFGKPRNLSDAKHMLRTLAGKTHEVITGVSVWMIAPTENENVSVGFRSFVEVSHVTFKPLTDDDITDYLRKGESFDKAGAYAAQGEGAQLIERVEGFRDTVIGLPVERLLREFPDLIKQ